LKSNDYGRGIWIFPGIEVNSMTVLNSSQDAFLRAFARSSLQSNFHLTGGTALAAFYLQHRYSEDLDFFTGDEAVFARVQK